MNRIDSVLTFNLGSTSVKVSLFECSRIADGDEPVFSKTLSTSPAPEAAGTMKKASPTAAAGNNKHLPQTAWLDGIAEQIAHHAATPSVIVHRIVHGGDLRGPCLLDASTRDALARLEAWAPSHQAPALALAAAASERWPDATQLVAFDTDWHRTLPALTRTLPLSAGLRARGLRRYGFHGLAYQSAWRMLSAAEPAARRGRAVFAHLGGGASLCAVLDGRSVDTTMSLTPLDGLPMATRCGSLDPGVILHLLRDPGRSADAIEDELSLRSGLLGLSGTSGDMQRLLASDSAEARLAIDIFVHRTAQGVAAMATSLGGIDDLVFSGGIGSHAAPIRTGIAERLAWTGLRLDAAANAGHARRIDAPGSAIRVWVVTVQEDRELAAAAAEWQKRTS